MFHKLAASIADQGVTSSTNFALNIILARWLAASDYGAFSVSWSLLLLLAAFHNALILEPMTVVGPSTFHADLPGYFQANQKLNYLVSALLALVAVIFALFYRQPVVRSCLLVLAVCVPGYLLLLTARRKQYVLNQPVRSLYLSLVYLVLVFVLIYALHSTGKLTAVTGVAAYGAAWFVWPMMHSRQNSQPTAVRNIATEHWRYGKWLFASSLLAIGTSDIQTLLLSMLVDLKAAGALRALMNFVTPLAQLLTVLSIYALPRLSSRARSQGAQAVLERGIAFPAALIILAAAYLIVLVLLAPQIERLLYSGKMLVYVKWMPLLAASAFVAAIGASFSTLLRAVQNSRHTFVAGVAGTIVGVACAFLLQRRLGIAGALWSLLAANTCSTAFIVLTYFQLLRRRHA